MAPLLQNLSILLFEADSQRYGFPLAAVDRVEPFVFLSPLPDVPPVVLGLADVHGVPVPVFDLHRRFTGKRGEYGVGSRLIFGHTDTRRFAVAAHDVLDIVELSADDLASLEILLPGAGRLPSVAADEEGLIYIQDAEALLTAAEEAELAAALGEGGP